MDRSTKRGPGTPVFRCWSETNSQPPAGGRRTWNFSPKGSRMCPYPTGGVWRVVSLKRRGPPESRTRRKRKGLSTHSGPSPDSPAFGWTPTTPACGVGTSSPYRLRWWTAPVTPATQSLVAGSSQTRDVGRGGTGRRDSGAPDPLSTGTGRVQTVWWYLPLQTTSFCRRRYN